MMTRLCTAGSDMEDLQDTIESCQDYGVESRSMLEEEELEEVRAIEIEVQEFAAELRAKKPGKGGKGGNKPSSTSGGKPSKPGKGGNKPSSTSGGKPSKPGKGGNKPSKPGKGGNKPSKPGKGGNGKGNNKPKCPKFQELVTGLKMKYADDYCVFNTYGMMEFDETTGNLTIDEEGIRNALGTLPEEIVAKFEGDEADTCTSKVFSSVIDKLGKCIDKYSAEEQAAISQFATAAVYYECFKVGFEMGCGEYMQNTMEEMVGLGAGSGSASGSGF